MYDRAAGPQTLYLHRVQLEDLKRFPAKVQNRMGYALNLVQNDDEPVQAKALKGFGGRSVLELIEDFDGDTYRAVYTVRFAGAVYVLHAFQKKSKTGSVTPDAILTWSNRGWRTLKFMPGHAGTRDESHYKIERTAKDRHDRR